MIYCKDCIYWGEQSYEEPSYHRCQHPTKLDVYPNAPPDGFGCYDGDSYNSGCFTTGMFFSCPHAKHSESP